jgi:hypothetical protein
MEYLESQICYESMEFTRDEELILSGEFGFEPVHHFGGCFLGIILLEPVPCPFDDNQFAVDFF